MKETAVEWLLNEIDMQYPEINVRRKEWMVDKAKEMEKEQIIEAHGKQLKKTQTASNYEYWKTGEQYYEETYGKK
jgi:hypothetical protein